MTELYVSEGALVRACDAVGVTTSSSAAARYRKAVGAAAPVMVSDELTRLLAQGPQWNGRAYRELETRARELMVPGVVCLPVVRTAAEELLSLADRIEAEANAASRSGQHDSLLRLAGSVREVGRSLRW